MLFPDSEDIEDLRPLVEGAHLEAALRQICAVDAKYADPAYAHIGVVFCVHCGHRLPPGEETCRACIAASRCFIDIAFAEQLTRRAMTELRDEEPKAAIQDLMGKLRIAHEQLAANARLINRQQAVIESGNYRASREELWCRAIIFFCIGASLAIGLGLGARP